MHYSHINPAVSKARLALLNRQDFIQQAQAIRQHQLSLPFSPWAGSQYQLYSNLYFWCRVFFRKRWGS